MKKLKAIQPDASDPTANESANEAHQKKANIRDNEPHSESSRSGSQGNQLKSIQEGDELIFARRDRSMTKVNIPPIPDLMQEDLDGGDLVFGNKKFDIDDFKLKSDSRLNYNL
jgi:hypothetical protein